MVTDAEKIENLCNALNSADRTIEESDDILDTVFGLIVAMNKRRLSVREEAIGCTHSACCSMLDRGEDPRTVDVQEFVKGVLEDLNHGAYLPSPDAIGGLKP